MICVKKWINATVKNSLCQKQKPALMPVFFKESGFYFEENPLSGIVALLIIFV